MYTVHKYPIDLEAGDLQSITTRRNAKILDVQMQNGVPTIWAFVDTDAPAVERRIVIVGTGHDARKATRQCSPVSYIGTIQLHNGKLVLHFFDKGEVV